VSLGVHEVLMFLSKMADHDKIIVSHTYNGVSYVSCFVRVQYGVWLSPDLTP